LEQVVAQSDLACLPNGLAEVDSSGEWKLTDLGEQVISLIRKQNQEVYDLLEQISDLRHGSPTIIKSLVDQRYNPEGNLNQTHPPCDTCGQPTWQGACAVELFSENSYLKTRLEEVMASKVAVQIELEKTRLSLHETSHPASDVKDLYDMVTSQGSLKNLDR